MQVLSWPRGSQAEWHKETINSSCSQKAKDRPDLCTAQKGPQARHQSCLLLLPLIDHPSPRGRTIALGGLGAWRDISPFQSKEFERQVGLGFADGAPLAQSGGPGADPRFMLGCLSLFSAVCSARVEVARWKKWWCCLTWRNEMPSSNPNA